MLTQEQLDILKAPFEPRDVSFVRNFAYGTEDAIADRIEMVDPSWTFERLSIEPRDKYVVATFRMTICDVWRDGVGMEKIDSATEPEKSAATDALKRAARLFGVGRYFQTLPGNVKDYDSYAKWYKDNVGNPTLPPAPPPAQKNGANEPQATPTPQTAENAGNGASDAIYTGKPAWFRTPVRDCFGIVKTYILKEIYANNTFAMNGSLDKHGISVKGVFDSQCEWAAKSAGELIHMLAHRHDEELPQASGQ